MADTIFHPEVAALAAANQNKKVVMDAIAAINKSDATGLTATLHPELHDSFTAVMHQVKSGFANMHLVIDDMVAEGDKVVTRWTMTGTHNGQVSFGRLGVVKPTQKPVEVSGITIHQIQGGKVIESWGLTNELGGLEQLGLMENYAKAAVVAHH